MKLLALSLGIALFGSLRVCSSKDASPTGAASGNAAATASVEAAGMLSMPPPRIGGSVVAVGDHAVELKLHQSGSIEGVVTSAVGELSEGATLSVNAATEGGGREETKLAFSKPHGRFEGRCKGKLAPGRVDIGLDAKGKAAKGKIDDAVIVRGPEVGGNVLVAGGHSAEVFVRPNGEVLGFVRDRAGADVKGDANLDVKAKVQTSAGATEDVSLVFEEPRGCFAGKAKAELAPGPIELGISAKGAASAGLGRLEKVSLLVDASHGGEVLVAGDYSAEIVLEGKGKSKGILAFVADASGKASADADLDVKVDFGADAGALVAVKWDAKKLCYRGALSADADFDVKPIRVEIGAKGKAFVGAAASLRAVVDARLKAAAKVDANADLKGSAKLDADAKANLKADVKAPTATAKVAVAVPAPKADAKAKAGAKAGGGAKASAKAKGSVKVGF